MKKRRDLGRKKSGYMLVAIVSLFGLMMSSCGDDTETSSEVQSTSNDASGSQTGIDDSKGSDTKGSAAVFTSTYEGLQIKLFEGQGCTASACHGSNAVGGLNLTADVSYEQLVEADSTGSSLVRVEPGDRMRSYLYHKLLAASEPDKAEIAGSPMPSGTAAIPTELLEALRLWIYAGAPKTGTVDGTAELLGADLPPRVPYTITPLAVPKPEDGFQLKMPTWLVPAGVEREVCFASYFDVRDQVPDENKDETGEFGLVSIEHLRQDPSSHHLIINLFRGEQDILTSPEYGEWLCRGGDKEGSACDPVDLSSCGTDGVCATTPTDGFACIGYGPALPGVSPARLPFGGAQKSQDYEELPDGVYRRVPLRGILYWNSHAFNLTTEDHMMNGRINFLYAKDPKFSQKGFLQKATASIFKPNAAPYTRQEVCSTLKLEKNSHLFHLNSHTHKRGEEFKIFHPDGSLLYENYLYNDPVRKLFDPPLVFDDDDAANRTLKYCAVYNNGVGPDGEPDPETVTRYSRLPESTKIPGVPGNCTPVACVSGKIGEACDGKEDHATCDSEPGKGDGMCDACAITGGESTENEMFLILGSYYIPDDK